MLLRLGTFWCSAKHVRIQARQSGPVRDDVNKYIILRSLLGSSVQQSIALYGRIGLQPTYSRNA